MAGKGGAREGAGRPIARTTLRTRQIAERAAREGVTPLEVLLAIMREQWEKYVESRTAENAQAAVAAAQQAAPYMHPKLASVEQFVDAKVRHFAVSSEPLTEDEWARTYDPLAPASRPPESTH